MRPALKWFVLVALSGMLVAACAAPYGANVPFLLEQDYRAMSDRELIAHEQELSDEILRASGASGRGDVGLGVGLGSWGRHGGVGIGVDQWLGGGSGDVYRELWQRREAVRVEMRARGLID